MKVLIYQVTYSATYWVVAESEQQAIELAIEEHSDVPNGAWEAIIDPYEGSNFDTEGEE